LVAAAPSRPDCRLSSNSATWRSAASQGRLVIHLCVLHQQELLELSKPQLA
jgi:hypothetical protein